MPLWQDNHVVVFRANSVNDPEAAGYVEQAFGVTFLTPNSVAIGGDIVSDGLGRLEGRTRLRRETEAVFVGFIRDYETEDDEQYLLVAHAQRLTERILTKPTSVNEWFIWIYKTYDIGSAPELGPIPRATIDDDGEVLEDMVFWAHVDDDPNGTLPRLVVLDGEAALEPRGDGSALSDLTITLLDADPL